LRKIPKFEKSSPLWNKLPCKNSFLQIDPRGLIPGFTVYVLMYTIKYISSYVYTNTS